ncbi:MAG: FAD-dependent thymidylate synthase [Pseudomonadota bacterium]
MILTLPDPWKSLREECYGNVEPEAALEAVTVPIDAGDGPAFSLSRGGGDFWRHIETLPAYSAGASYGSREKLRHDMDRRTGLNKKLIELGHHTPLEAVQFNFSVAGISKASGAQVSRHRIGQGHVSSSRRFQEQHQAFVYPMLAYLTDEAQAKSVLQKMSETNRRAVELYRDLRENGGLKKEDARRVIPVSSAQERVWWINARALRDFFRLRLARDAEWEVRRLAAMLYNIVIQVTPSLFEDIKVTGFEK